MEQCRYYVLFSTERNFDQEGTQYMEKMVQGLEKALAKLTAGVVE